MNYNKIFNKAFSSLTPITKNKEICSNVMERAKKMNEKKKITFKRPLAVVIAAAATIAAATISVGAATGWDFNGAFDSLFKKNTEWMKTSPDYQENDIYEGGFDFSKYGKELDLHYTFDDYTLSIKGVIADETTAYIVYDVVFDKDYDYKEKKDYTNWEMISLIETTDKAMHTNDGDIISVDDNRFTFYQMATGSTENKTLAGNTLVVDFYRLSRGIENSVDCDALYSEEQTLDCGLTVEIPVDFPIYEPRALTVSEENSKANLIDWKNGKEFEVEAKLETISISPLSCDFSFMTVIPADGLSKGDGYGLDDFYFTDTSGKQIEFHVNSYSVDVDYETGAMRYHVRLNKPIDPDNIVSATVGGTTIELK